METQPVNRNIEVDEKILKYLNTARKWAMFLAIIGFIILGLGIVLGIIAGTFLTVFNLDQKGLGIPDSLTFIPILLLGIIFCLPGVYLLRFSRHSGLAVKTLDKKELNKAFRNLKFYFLYTGLLIILLLLCYVAVLLFAGTTTSLLKWPG
jgi:MFS family permease